MSNKHFCVLTNFTLVSLSLSLSLINYIVLLVGGLPEWLLSQDRKMDLDDEYLSQSSLMDALSIVLMLYYVRLELLNLHLEI